MTTDAVSLGDIRAAATRIAPYEHRTPIATCATLDRIAGYRIPQTKPGTIADGLRTSLGDLTWPTIRDRVGVVLSGGDVAVELRA